MVEDPRIRSPAAVYKEGSSTTEKAARPGRRAESQTRTVPKRPETLEESATQNPRARGPEGWTVLSTPNATPVLGLGRGDDSTVVYPSPIDRSFDVLDSQKPKTGRACLDNPSGHHGAEEQMEAASAQAVNRGHQVTMIKVPDAEDDTSYRKWAKRGSPMLFPIRKQAALPTPPLFPKMTDPLPNEGVDPKCDSQNEVTSPTVAAPSLASAKVAEVPHRWMRPFEVDWTLRAICEARNNNTARAALAVWVHKDKGAEMTDELLRKLRLGGEEARERLYELRKPPVVVLSRESSTSNFLVDILLNPTTGTKTLSTRGLLDSGCMSSAIN